MPKAYFLSDLHLKDPNEINCIKLTTFLATLLETERAGCELFLVGDIFDLWIADHQVFAQKFANIVNLIEKCVRHGFHVHFFEGNHDLYLQRFWEESLGVQVHKEATYFKLGTLVVRVEHGDEINLDDKSYLRLRSFLRLDWMEALSYRIPGAWLSGFGDLASRTSRKFSQKKRQRDRDGIRGMIRHHAERSFAEAPFDLIVTGHMHVLDEWSFSAKGSTVHSVNLGTWMESPRVFVVSDDPKGEWIAL